MGSDIKRGQVVLQAGDMLEAPEIGILATVGASKVKVMFPACCLFWLLGGGISVRESLLLHEDYQYNECCCNEICCACRGSSLRAL